MDYNFHGFEEKVRLDFTGLDSRYPYYRRIGRAGAGEIPRRRFTASGGSIEWHTELVSVAVGRSGWRVSAQRAGSVTVSKLTL